MKNVLVILLILVINIINAQKSTLQFQEFCPNPNILPLRYYDDIPEDECYYKKDTNNELLPYVGTWTGTWDNKTIYITFKKVEKRYDDFHKYYEDLLIAKFKVINSDGNVLFDNTTIIDYNAKIFWGGCKI